MADGASSPELRDAITEHWNQTKGQVDRLKQIFTDLGENPDGNFCEATEGLLREGEQVLHDVEKGAVRDAAIIGAAQRVEHYEVAAYGTCRAFAKLLGFDSHVKLLQETLNEEKMANTSLNTLAVNLINDQAMAANHTEVRR